MSSLLPWRRALDRASRRAPLDVADPFVLLRLAVGGLLLTATLVALVLAILGNRLALELALSLWALYGFAMALVSGVLEPLIDAAAGLLGNAGFGRSRGYSGIDAMIQRGEIEAAAVACAERAREPGQRVDATLRRATLLAGPMVQAPMAVDELEALRATGLAARDDLRVGLALVAIHERELGDPGRAMVELRRLIDLHGGTRAARHLRRELAALKSDRFGPGAR